MEFSPSTQTGDLPAEAIALLGTKSDRELARHFGVSPYFLKRARISRGIEAYSAAPALPAELVSQLGKVKDTVLAEQFGVSTARIFRQREALDIPRYRNAQAPKRPPCPRRDPLISTTDLGKMSDADTARKLGVSVWRVKTARKAAKIPPYKPYRTPIDGNLLGTMGDAALAKKLKVCVRRVKRARVEAGIPPYRASSQPKQKGKPKPKPICLSVATTSSTGLPRKLVDQVKAVELPKELEVSHRRVPTARVVGRPRQTANLPEAAIKLLGMVSDRELSARFGVPVGAVENTRQAAGIPTYRSIRGSLPLQKIAARLCEHPADKALLGSRPDPEVAKIFGVGPRHIARQRKLMGIPEFRRTCWTPELLALLGTVSDAEVADRSGGTLTVAAVENKRHKLRIPICQASVHAKSGGAALPEAAIKLLGTISDRELAARFGVKASVVRNIRLDARIPTYLSVRGSLPFQKIAARLSEHPEDKALFGRKPDPVVARIFGVSPEHIARQRELMGIPKFRRTYWTAELLALLGTVSDEEVAVRSCGALTVAAVKEKRYKLKIPICETLVPAKLGVADSPDVLALLGKISDYEISARTGVQRSCITLKRKSLGIPPATGRRKRRTWTSEELALLGNMSDSEIASKLGLSSEAVAVKRRQYLGEGKVGEAVQALAARLAVKPTEVALLGTKPDAEIASMFGVGTAVVVGLRAKYKIPAFTKGGWTQELSALIGTIPDRELAARSGGALSVSAVTRKRKRLGIPAFAGSL